MVFCNRRTGGDCNPVYASDFGNVLVVNDTLKGSFNCQVKMRFLYENGHFFLETMVHF